MLNFAKILEFLDTKVAENVTHTHAKKVCLLSYITYPFLFPFKPQPHQSHWQVQAIAKVLDELGYRVDVVNYGANYQLKRNYDLVIDIHPTVDKPYWKFLTTGARKIIFFTGSFPDYQNDAERRRLLALKKRRGVQLQPRRQVEPINTTMINRFDAVLLIGNTQTQRTFPPLSVPFFLIPNTVDSSLFPLAKLRKDPKHFLFFGSGGQVHKGLDLVLEVFRDHPELTLTVCSPFAQEEDFAAAYHTELYETENIHPLGFVDPHSPAFKSIAARCAWMIYPSASEGMAGSVLTAMSAGIVPIVSKESGISSGGKVLSSISIEEIEKIVVQMSKFPQMKLEKQRNTMMQGLETTYSQQAFSSSLRAALKELLS